MNSKRDFSLYSKIIDFSNYLEQYVISNIPKENRNLRIHFLDEVYMLSKNMFSATYNKGNVRIKYLIELQVNISLLDMMLNQLRQNKKCPKKHLDVAISKLGDIKNIIYGWRINEESQKK